MRQSQPLPPPNMLHSPMFRSVGIMLSNALPIPLAQQAGRNAKPLLEEPCQMRMAGKAARNGDLRDRRGVRLQLATGMGQTNILQVTVRRLARGGSRKSPGG